MSSEAVGTMRSLSELERMRFRDNPKEHDVPGVAASIVRFGFTIWPGIDVVTATMVTGHGRVKALRALKDTGPVEGRPWPPKQIVVDDNGEWWVPTIDLAFDSEDERNAYVMADNALVEAGGWSEDTLRMLLAREGNRQLASIGFSTKQYNRLMSGFRIREKQPDKIIPPPESAVAQLGQVWMLGRHRIFVGDARDAASYARVLDGAMPTLTLTSPPYNARNDARQEAARTRQQVPKYLDHDDDLSSEEWRALILQSMRNALAYSRLVAMNVQQLAGNKVALFEVLHELRHHFVDVAVWDKESAEPASGPNVMNSQFEYVYFFSPDELPKRRFTTSEFHGTVSNVYKGPRARNEQAELHQATMPLHLAQWILRSFDAQRLGVLDPFCGLGTTVIACEMTGRTAYGIEIEPRYVDAAIARWEHFTGERATLLDG